MNIDVLLELVKMYNKEEVGMIRKAYEYANEMHSGQTRQSGEPYIIHPLNVAYIVAEMHADRNTVCAALLHDTLEDTHATKEEIAELFNSDIANLVDGVTKISKMNFSSKAEQNLANTRKIITSITDDVRIIIIKLADRLHNMRTLEYKSVFKQKENSLETLEIFVPLAYYIGAYRIKSELEDISFRYLKPKEYRKLYNIMSRASEENNIVLTEVLQNIEYILKNENIPNEIKVRTKNLYGIYKRQSEGYKISDIHDLLSLKIMVNELWDCYKTLGLIHSKYHPVNEMFKDYICNPKTNLYQSLHTTIFAPHDKLVQTQIRTFDMDKIASFGLTAYWDINKGDARDKMQQDLRENFQFFRTLTDINNMFLDNKDFVSQVKQELFNDNIYVYTSKGDIIELPKNSTVIDFAYKIHTDVGNTLVGAKVNGEYVTDLGQTLKNRDRITVITDDYSYGPRAEWLDKVNTSNAKKKIKEFNKKIKDE